MKRDNIREIPSPINSYGAHVAFVVDGVKYQFYLGSFPTKQQARAAAMAGKLMRKQLRKFGVIPDISKGRPKKATH